MDWYKKSTYDPQENATHDFYEKITDQEYRVLNEFVQRTPGQSQPWHPVPFARVQKIWSDFNKFGFVREIRGMDMICDKN